MSEDRLIRLANLRALSLSARELEARTGLSYTYWRALLQEDTKKSFAEKAARKLEATLELPRGCMDLVDGVGAIKVTGNQSAAQEQARALHSPATPTRRSYQAVILANWLDHLYKEDGERTAALHRALTAVQGPNQPCVGPTTAAGDTPQQQPPRTRKPSPPAKPRKSS